MSENSKTALKAAIVATLMAGLIATAAEAAPQNNGQPADTIHPNIHGKVGQGDGTNANPNGNGNGGQIHGIGNVPGQSDADASGGFADQLQTVHGGIGQYNKNALP
jgi:hypothetical protein